MSITTGIKNYYELFGIRGLCAISSFRLFGTPKEVTAKPFLVRPPVHLRVRTSDISVYKDILLRGEYDLGLKDFVPKTIVDAGANIGMATLYYANKYPNAKIAAVEPEASNFATLVRNVSSYPNVIPINAALWNKDGRISLEPNASPGEKWAFKTHEGDGTRVRSVTMRTLMAEVGFDAIDLLKVDIEGAEKEVFESCNWIEDIQVIAIELHDRMKPGCRAVVTSAAKEFRQWERGEMTFFVRNAT